MKFSSQLFATFALGLTLGGLGTFLYMDVGQSGTIALEPTAEEPAAIVLPAEQQRAGFSNSDDPPPETAVVTRVFDGLTIGLDSGHVVRYLGVRLPSVFDTVQCFGKEALLANEGMLGQTIRLEEDPVLTRAKDGAWIRYVWVNEGGAQPHEDLPSVVMDGPPGADTVLEEPPVDPSEPELLAQSTVPESEDSEIEDLDAEVKEYLVTERIIELGLGFPLLGEEMTYFSRLEAASRFSSATRRGLWGACEISTDTGQFETQEVSECVIKGVTLLNDSKVYRNSDCTGYPQTIVLQQEGDKWFCSVDEAISAGYELARDCPE